MARVPSFVIIAGLSALAAGFTQPVVTQGRLAPSYNPSVYSVHQPVVQRSDYVLDLAAGNGLAPSDAARLQAWLDGLQLGYGDRVWVDEGTAYGGGVRQDVAAIVQSYGLLLSDGAPVTAGAVQPGTARVIVSRMNASVPTCPDWSDARPGSPTSPTHTNYGCAVNSNLAAMIADPADLVLGQSGTSDAAAGARAVRSYRDRPQSGAAGQVKPESPGAKQ